MNTRQTLALLRDYESRNVLFTEPDGSWPIVWERAKGVHVWDAEKKKYLDLTAAFGGRDPPATRIPPWFAPAKSRWPHYSTRWAMCIRTRSKPSSRGN